MAIRHAVVHNTQAAHTFSAGFKCKHCKIDCLSSLVLMSSPWTLCGSFRRYFEFHTCQVTYACKIDCSSPHGLIGSPCVLCGSYPVRLITRSLFVTVVPSLLIYKPLERQMTCSLLGESMLCMRSRHHVDTSYKQTCWDVSGYSWACCTVHCRVFAWRKKWLW